MSARKRVPHPPRATYRMQFHAGFTFADAAAALPALAALGVSHVYASPIQAARRGSTHGYDVADPTRLNPELGGEAGFFAFTAALARHGMGVIVDIVPNHMGIGPENPWWMSVLALGRASPHAPAFDIDWDRPGADGRLILPVLGRPYGEALEAGEIRPALDAEFGLVALAGGSPYPLAPGTWADMLSRAAEQAGANAMPVLRSLAAASGALGTLPRRAQAEASRELRDALRDALAREPGVAEALDRALQALGGRAGDAASLGPWHDVLESQHWRLAHWRVAASDINYRRFFEVNDLAGVRVEDPAVFDATHGMILSHVRAGRIQGLRIDHVDGLADPALYLARLREAVGPDIFIVVEKILEASEALPDWPVQGTTGYEVLGWLDGIMVDRSARALFEEVYRQAAGTGESFADQLARIRRETLERGFGAEREGLVMRLAAIAARSPRTRDVTAGRLRAAATDMLAAFPVYRTYRGTGPASEQDRRSVDEAFARAVASTAQADAAPHAFVRDLLLGHPLGPAERDAVTRFEQLTGPLMAKSLEDTLFYRWTPLLALDEVGADPPSFGLDVEAFHQRIGNRARHWPQALVATATHDTKRGEDTRARMLALTEDAPAWPAAVARFHAVCAETGAAPDAPDALDRLILLQTLLGAWPVDLLQGDTPAALGAFAGRVGPAMTKALREAKRRTSWLRVNEAYEAGMTALVAALLEPGSAFLSAFRPMAARLARAGMLNALSRTVLKLTLPGVPDFYQGTELWDLSLVDPDNRRPVDAEARAQALADPRPLPELAASWTDGRLKQRVTCILLQLRADLPELFARGDYQPLAVSGRHSDHVMAFARRLGSDTIVTLAALRAGSLVPAELPLGPAWDDTAVHVPDGRWRDALSGAACEARAGRLGAAEAFASLPVAVLGKAV